jgi:uncharacterized protein HemX
VTTLTPAVAALVALIAAAVSVATFLSQRRKTSAEADSTTVATALSLLPAMREQIAELRARIDELELRDRAKAQRIDELESGVSVLHEQIRQLGHDPKWPTPARRIPIGD